LSKGYKLNIMSIGCIFGHAYSDIQREERKNESGKETIITIKEYKKCVRCNKIIVLNERKEIKSIEYKVGNGEEIDGETKEDAKIETSEWPVVEGIEDIGFSAELPEKLEENVEFGGGLIPKSVKVSLEDSDGSKIVKSPVIETIDEKITEYKKEIPSVRLTKKKDEIAYLCKECGFKISMYRSSLRKGDVCPECRGGYIDEKAVIGKLKR